jgi:uncharacterized protein YndB with AHSA1/START domain
VTDEDALHVVTTRAAVPREILWEWMTSPARRMRWTSGVTGIDEDLAGGRRGIGAVNHCAHGKSVSLEEIVDWVPPEYVTKRINMQVRGMPRMLVTMELLDRGPSETDIVWRLGRPRSTKDRLVMELIWGKIRPGIEHDSATLIELAAADAGERAAGRQAEPDVPASTARHLSAPVAASSAPIAYLPDEPAAE